MDVHAEDAMGIVIGDLLGFDRFLLDEGGAVSERTEITQA